MKIIWVIRQWKRTHLLFFSIFHCDSGVYLNLVGRGVDEWSRKISFLHINFVTEASIILSSIINMRCSAKIFKIFILSIGMYRINNFSKHFQTILKIWAKMFVRRLWAKIFTENGIIFEWRQYKATIFKMWWKLL